MSECFNKLSLDSEVPDNICTASCDKARVFIINRDAKFNFFAIAILQFLNIVLRVARNPDKA